MGKVFYYLIFVLTVFFLELSFPIRISYVRIFIVINCVVLLGGFFPRITKPSRVLFIIISVLFVLSALISDRLYNYLYRDLANLVLIGTFMPIFYKEIDSKQKFFLFREKLFFWIFILGTVIAFIGTYKFYLLTTSGIVPEYFQYGDVEFGIESFRLGTSLVADYNYYAYGLFCSLTTIPFFYRKVNNKRIYEAVLIFSFLLISFNIAFSSSRRGIVILVLYIIMLIVQNLIRRKSPAKQKKRKWSVVIVAIVILGCSAYWLDKNLNTVTQSNDLEMLLARIETLEDRESVTSPRTERWMKSFEIIGEYNMGQLVIGDGFEYIKKLGITFRNEEDYPHNFLISAFLYGGVLTLSLVLALLFTTYKKYVKLDKESRIFLVWFLFGLLMLLTSKNSMYSIQFILFLFLMPYLDLKNENSLVIKKRPTVDHKGLTS